MLKKGLSVLIALIICFSAVTVLPSSAATESGYDSAAIGATLNYNGFNYTVDSNSKVTITGYTGSSESITIPAKINGNVVVGIGTGAFRGKTTITEVKIEAALTSMGNYAFGYCSGLKSVTINSGTTVLGYYAFGECSSLERVTLPGTLTTIGSYAFYRCSKLTQNITIPDSVTEIGSYAFESSGISSIKFGSKVQKIGASAFALCGNIVNVTLPDSVTSIGQGAFGTCGKLETVKIGNNVSEMGNYAFGYNDSLKEVYIAEGTTVIGKYAFAYIGSAYKSNLSKVTIPASVIKIGNANSENKVYKDNEVFGIGRTVTAVIHGVNGSFAQDFCNANAEACNLQWYNGGDTTKPSVSIYSENEVTSEQKVTLSMSGNVGLAGYYWGTSSSKSPNFTSISGTSYTTTKYVRSGGTYYLTVKDTSGNIAQTSATFYMTTLDANGGSVSPSSVVTRSGYSFDFPTPLRLSVGSNGPDYMGWSTDRSASSGIYTLKPSSDQTYYAIWSDISADTTSPTASISSTNNVSSNQTVTLTMSDNVGLDGYYFRNIRSGVLPEYKKISGKNYSTTVTVSSSGTYQLTVYDTNGNSYNTSVTFCNTTLDANGGSVSPASVLTKYGNSFTMPTPTRSGYTFNGWSADSSASSGIYSLSPTLDQTYYAVWKSGSDYSLTLSPESVTMYVDESVTVNVKFSGDGIKYLGFEDGDGNICSAKWGSVDWSKGTGSFVLTGKKPGKKSFVVQLIDSSNNILYSESVFVTVIPKVDTQQSFVLTSTNDVASIQEVALEITEIKDIKGYYWGTNADYSKNKYVEVEYVDLGGSLHGYTDRWQNVDAPGTYYATLNFGKTISKTVSITFYKTTLNANGGSVSPAYVLTKAGNSFGFPTPSRSGYSYKGWSTSSSATSGVYYLTPTGNQVYYAVWGYDHSITFSPEDVTVYEGESITVTVKFTGDDVKKLRYVNGDDSICSASWGKVDWGTKTVPIAFYGISPGTVTFDIQLLNSSEEEIYSKNISVKVLPKPSDALIKVLDAKGTAGKTVDVPITISGNPGVIGMTLSVSYDNSALELVGVKDAGILGNNSHKPEYTSPYTLSWANDTSVTNYTANGTIATLTFRIKDGVSAGKYDVRVSYDYDNYDIFDKDLNKVRFGVENGSVEVVNYIFGDVNSDGTVNNLDRVYLTRYLADWNDYQDIDLKAADVDCNGIVNNLDRVILTRYLANWADCSELPYRG